MLSDGRLSALVSTAQNRGQHKTVHIEQEGPIAYVESTTLGIKEIFNEDRTRFIILCSNEGIEQSKAIIDAIALSACQPSTPDKADSILALHHTAQRLLKPYDVLVPFAPDLRGCLPAERVEVRRTFGHLISLIQAVALLHQFQREITDDGLLIATLADYEIVRAYLAEPLARSLGCGLTPGAKELLEYVRLDGEYTVPDLEGKFSISVGTIRSRNKELLAAGQVRLVAKGKGRSPDSYVAVSNAPPLHGLDLPDLRYRHRYLSCNAPETVVSYV